VNVQGTEVLGVFHGDESFPIVWEEGERELLWILDDLHCPNPVSPMFFDIGGWWLTCDHMFRRFATPFACDWVAKNINGYVYTAAVPPDADLRVEATEYQARYVPRVPRNPRQAQALAPYLDWTLPHYAESFTASWRDRLRPEIERNFAYLDGRLAEEPSLVELAVLLEDAIDIHERHWKIHWMLNFGQLSATVAVTETMREVRGEADEGLVGRLQSSLEDRNWDSIEALWRMKEEVKADEGLLAAFSGEADEVLGRLASTERGRRFLDERLDPYRLEFGNRSIWSHEFVYPTWREEPGPIVEAIRGYIASDYDYPAAIEGVRRDLDAAVHELMDPVAEGPQRDQLQAALDRATAMNPLTPDHHFFIDQGTNARLRLVLVAIGRKLAEAQLLSDPEDVVFLRYNELRALMADPAALDAAELVATRRTEREVAFALRPPEWVGTATAEALAFPYLTNWGFPDRFYRSQSSGREELSGLPASRGVVEGPARLVDSPAQFDSVQQGDVLVCKMTNPAWVIVFTKIVGLVTDSGGVVSHPAVLSREFGIPSVVGTSVATERIATGDRIRVDGTAGTVEILERTGAKA
jgi:phosphohistidine swiveling domain-containing protein